MPTALALVSISPVEELIVNWPALKAPPPGTSSKIVPFPDAPPVSATPKRLPLLSSIKEPCGFAPFPAPLKEASVTSALVSWTNSKTVPSPEEPPALATPKKLPILSSVRPAKGAAPLAPVNVARLVIELLPWAISKIVPSPAVPPPAVVPKRLPWASRTI